ncbi:sensor histidine kinase [Stackebrandtia nassauensis]|uniref:histidine kinase n=1 Tax=Stackebrandtia nassauensis (strain DSM 44728 / CIP 108903 / NRRL B-16338 / NBRC 102104 / LLR-40K-21) TaxID=446470 RepID=D3PZY5_STANL|nr:HAMP domain-containing sensor histidine kinase [Stackebrandtia nassauensis]ADD43672.1 histidine kinase [Stackebrandtia nassauensis DSM 44728]
MRWALAKVAIASTLMVALAFCIPLGMVVRQVAEERALSQARDAAGAMVTVLAATEDPVVLRRAVSSESSGVGKRIAVHLNGEQVIGKSHVETSLIRKVARQARTSTETLPDGVAYLRTVLLPEDRVAVIEVYVPDKLLTKGVNTAWLTLAGIAVALVGVSVLMADRLGARVVRSTRTLADATSRFGAGDLSVRVDPSGPDELQDAGLAFNMMADKVVRLVDGERELAADMSHRLRTPLTALRLDAESLGGGADARRMRASVDALEAEVDAVIAGARRSITDRSGQRCDVAEVVRERISMWSVLAEDHGRRYRVVGLRDSLWVNISRDDVMSCVDALVGNVFAHTPQDAPFSLELNSATGRFIVEDGGPGIADPMTALTRGESGAGSSGLGLDIVARISKAAGGRLHIGRSALGGARIVWTFGDAVYREPQDNGNGRRARTHRRG